ncbi:hypothetical protein F8388_010739 [Cannabis sativa]|uniref:Uncharacterized protein n=1 Tax=Cannabis sativa TaxID=3483 RepID=A0A7J6GMZ5_CANSA|nr:hypothetical protein F8388_010739 [Cannabis sativa]KAF4384296.1 hypothetical protein G4B88_016862 [Cannabis sativa]
MMKKFMVMALVVGVMVVGCFGRLQPDIHLNMVPNRCRVPGEYCHWAQDKYCCEGLQCEVPAATRCVATLWSGGDVVYTPGLALDVQQNAS